LITAGLELGRATGTRAWHPWYQANLARAYALIDRLDDGRRCIAEAATAVEATKEGWCAAEIHRIAGELALIPPQADAAGAESHFQRALEMARAQQTKSWELRAAMSMARLWRDQGKRQQAHDLLAPVHGWFKEGLDTVDLKQASELLNELDWPTVWFQHALQN
jgi:predicted ATPase